MDVQKLNLEESIEELGKIVELSAKEIDNPLCESLAEEARIIYEQYPESEDIALRYAMVLFNLLVKQENVEELLNTINSVKEIFVLFKHSETIASQYAKALVNLSAKQINVEDRLKTAELVKEIFDQFKYSEEIALRYAMALFNLSNNQNDINDRKETISKLEDLTLKFQNSQDIALRYANALFNLSNQQNDINDRKEIVSKLEVLTLKFQYSELIALRYASSLVNLSNQQNDIKQRKETISELEALTLKFQNSELIALRYAMALVNLSIKQTEPEEISENAQKIQAIYKKFNEPQDIALQYAMVLVSLSAEQTKLEDITKTVQKIQTIYKKFDKYQDIALNYAMALVNLSIKQTEPEEISENAQKIQAIYKKFNEPQDIALQYAMVLVSLSAEQTKLEDITKTVQKIQTIYKKFNKYQDIALNYAMALVNLSLEQANLDKLNDTASKLKKIAFNFEKNEDINLCYSEVLANIITKQPHQAEKFETMDKLTRLYHNFEQSEEITVQYLTARKDFATNNLIEHSTLVNDICQSLRSIPSINILNILIEILENEEQFEQDQVQFPTTNIIKALDQLCFNSSIKEEKEDKEKNLLIRTLKLGIISDTKYDILKAWIDYYRDDSPKINQLIKIYTLVQQLKYELGLKAEEKNRKLKFGHYTSGKALQSILGKEEKAPFSISGKTHLNNANYMNDPEEGVILEDILKLQKGNPLDPSSWFLMSFTSKTDDLAMWSQYGNNAEGVCIVLNENDFAHYHSLSDLPWYQKNSDKQISHKMNSNVEIPNDISLNESGKEMTIIGNENVQISEGKHSISNNNRDYLYRVAYVHYSDDQFDIEETELFTSEEVTRLKGLLVDLKSELRDYKNSGDPFYKKAIADCIEEIRYLFKSVDYKYEEELRILQYANLNSDNDKIKIDYSPEFGKLYLEREENIQIGEVIFGPKFPNPEYVTPLLKLLDKNIKYKKSTIKFR